MDVHTSPSIFHRLRILFTVEEGRGKWSFFSSPQAQNPVYVSSSSLVVAADFHIKFPRDNKSIYYSNSQQFSWGYTSGLICFSGMRISKDMVPVICNPITGHYAILPKLNKYRKSSIFLGFDPIDKQFKVLSMGCIHSGDGDDHLILTLGTKKLRWRKIQCPLPHEPSRDGICINGIFYYIAENSEEMLLIACFDVRSEKFKFIHVEYLFDYWSCNLINYKDKLGGIILENVHDDGLEMRMWILEDVEKPRWSKHAYTLPENKVWMKRWSNVFVGNDVLEECNVFVVGVTSTGEIVLSENYRYNVPFYVFYFNPERNTLKGERVEIQAFGVIHNVYGFLGHVDDLNVHDAKLLMSSISPPSVTNKRSGQSSWRKSMNH